MIDSHYLFNKENINSASQNNSNNEEYTTVNENNKYNFRNKEGNLISNEWFYKVQEFTNGKAIVINGDM